MKLISKLIISVIILHRTVFSRGTWNEVAHHPAWKTLEMMDCGESASDRIIGGHNAALGQFPWIARLGYSSPYETDIEWMCGGALVTRKHIVTAAHCVQSAEGEYELTLIRVGEHNTNKNPDCQLNVCAPKVQDRNVTAIRSHSKFNKPPFHNDIAILVVNPPFDLNDYVAPICLPQAEQLSDLELGELVTVAGWGKMNMTTDERAIILQYISLPIVKAETCNLFGKGFKLAESEICAGAQQNKDACGGDSGGPMMKVFDTPEGPKNYLLGVVSFGPTICGIRKPGVYASVTYFLKWILDNLL